MNNTEKLDKTEEFVESIYGSMDSFHKKHIESLETVKNYKDKRYEFVRKLYVNLNDEDKELFSGYIKSIVGDITSTMLADFDVLRYTDVYPYEELKIICDDVELKPYLFETFLATFQEKNPDME